MGSAAGALKTAAARVGLNVEEYTRRRDAGLKWCTACKVWHARQDFPADRSRGDGHRAKCLGFDNGVPRRSRRYPERDRARNACRKAVLSGRLPYPNTVPCSDCGQIWETGLRRHEYDHYLGYAPEHRLDVQAVCTLCHADREKKRRAD